MPRTLPASHSFAFGQRWTPAVRALILAMTGVYVFQMLLGNDPSVPLAGLQSPECITQFRWWQPFTYLFLHASFWHLLFNGFTLWMFGCEVELVLGSRRFWFYYLLTGIGSGVCVAGVGFLAHEHSLTVGASGAIFGVLLAYGVLFAERPLTLLLFFVLPVQMKARTMVVLFAAFEFLAGVGQAFGRVSHLAHLSGLVIGLAYFLFARVGVPFRLQWWASLRNGWRERRLKHSPAPSEDELDLILDKIAAKGISALSQKEKDLLSEAARSRQDQNPGNN